MKRLLGGATALATVAAPLTAGASSHREAPFLTKNPKVDGTDFYMFNSYEAGRGDYVTILANYIPVQDAYGGPNYFTMDPDAVYEIHIDNNGDAVEDITFQFDFDVALAGGTGIALPVGPAGQTKNVAVPFSAVAPVSAGSEGGRNVLETYKVNVIRGDRRTGTAMPIVEAGTTNGTFGKPLDNIGTKTIPSYAAYADSFIKDIDIPGCTPPAGTHPRIFVGQRKEGFAVNLGEVFDLIALSAGEVTGAPNQNKNIIDDKNITTLALEVPKSCLVAGGSTVIGGWTTASVRQARVINPTATFAQPAREGGPLVQVSRLGMPLVNEVVIGLPDKDRFNSSEPKDDAQFADYVTNPTLPEVVELLFGGAGVTAPDRFPRTDLVTVFLTGVPNVNNTGATLSEMLRLNTAIPATPRASQSRFGAATCFDPATATADATLNTSRPGCDPAGFPNGRRPGDDITDLSLRVAMGVLINTTDAAAGQIPYVDGAAPGTLADGSDDPLAFGNAFPYLTSPIPGAQ
ncbi:MAG TPA: DUF4331 domain-containing protein [Kofleriaceae bacterium]|nr:DUF4331 domain-containing protein [Kofleriaceae bacterium]